MQITVEVPEQQIEALVAESPCFFDKRQTWQRREWRAVGEQP